MLRVLNEDGPGGTVTKSALKLLKEKREAELRVRARSDAQMGLKNQVLTDSQGLIPLKRTMSLFHEANQALGRGLLYRIQLSLLAVPDYFRRCFLDCLLIPYYRTEWRKYRLWQPRLKYYNREERQEEFVNRRYRRDLLETERRVKSSRRLREQAFPLILVPHDHENCKRITINVGGSYYETQLRTLNRFPKTLLGDPLRRLPFFDAQHQFYYFDRHRQSFEMILYYYQSGGRILRPHSVDTFIFYSEIEFFDLGEDVLSEYRDLVGISLHDEDLKVLPKNLLQRKLWLLLEFPESSRPAWFIAVLTVFAIVLSTTSFCVKTVPYFGGNEQRLSESPREHEIELTEIFDFTEAACNLWFLVEFILKFSCAPNKRTFCFSIVNTVDFLAILPYLLQIVVSVSSITDREEDQLYRTTYFYFLRLIRLVQVFRVFKLSRYSDALRVLHQTIVSSEQELLLLIFLLAVCVVLFASSVYIVELGSNKNFTSIPAAFYWGVLTMTTVGSGDAVPITNMGRLVGTLAAIAGVLTVSLPVPVVVSNFNYFYTRVRDRKRSEELYNTKHVLMCSFLPGPGGVPPEFRREEAEDNVINKEEEPLFLFE